MAKNTPKKPWAGRFAQATHKLVEDFTASLPFDRRLYRHDIAGSIAHAKMLAKQGIIPRKDARAIEKGLKAIQREIEAGTFPFDPAQEDIHMAIEQRLTEMIGPAGARLHTARSRNDQVALDLRLYLREEIAGIIDRVEDLQRAFLDHASAHLDVILPGYTHLQRAQPVLLAHHWLAYVEMLDRDKARMADAMKRVNVLPLGSGALAGTPYPIDRAYVAELLNFPAVSENSLDAVGDRDFVVEFLAAAALLMIHLSRLGEELVLWSTEEFGWIELPDAFCTGSSMMPQKKNPDVPELVRGKAGRVVGHLVGLLVTLKGLPLAYNRDLQEDKEPLFDAVDTLKASLSVMAALIPGIAVRRDRVSRALEEGFLTATDLADWLVQQGVPFREAHRAVGQAVRYCLEHGLRLEALDPETLRRFHPAFSPDALKAVKVEAAVDARKATGGTARSTVKRRLQVLRRRLGSRA